MKDTTQGILILVGLIIIAIISPKVEDAGPNTSQTSRSTNTSNASLTNTASLTSPYSNSISINTGNASYVYQPNDEYITLYNRGRNTIDITGWQLHNGKNERAYYLSGAQKRFSADIAVIPQSTLALSSSGNNVFQNIMLQGGETAVVTTGRMGSQLPYKIVSFKENMCSGYLEAMPEYTFTPPLSRNCPRPADEPGITSLDNDCRRFVERMPTCHTPSFSPRDKEGEPCSTCIDNERLSSACVAFVQSHFNYGSCVANHSHKPDFFSRTWRIFLDRGWEMWAREYETIKLFDQLGRLVNYYSY